MTATTTGVRFTVNGLAVEASGSGSRRLLDVLREDLGLTGTKEGCGEGECGACSVLVDGQVVDSCLVPVCQVHGCDVRTVEGLATDGRLGPLQQAFLKSGAVQCGFCTPGILVSASAFLDSGAEPTEDAVREAIAGNLCRCTGYTRIVEAIRVTAAPGAREEAAMRLSSTEVAPAAPRPSSASTGAAAGSRPPVETPGTLGEALRVLAAGAHRPIAGGTDLMVALAAGTAGPGTPLLDLWRLDELRGIRIEGTALVLGALTTYTELRRSRVVRERLPVLAEMAALVGAAQIQNRGTIGGNAVNASPAGDTLPILLATDAVLVAGSVRGEREIAAADFWTGYRRTALAPDELLLRVRIPLRPGRTVRFRKVGTRHAMSIAKASIAVAWRTDAGGAWHDVRVALGSVAERAIRAPRAEAVLEGTPPSPEVAERAAAVVTGEVSPIDDVRSTADYRRTVTGRVLRRIVLEALAGGTGRDPT